MNSASGTVLQSDVWKPVLISGFVAVLLGGAILAWPAAGLSVAGILFGGYLLISGATQIFLAFRLPLASGAGRALNFISGTASIILAVLCFRSIAESILLLGIWIAVGFIFRGMSMVVTAVADVDRQGRGWVAFSGVIGLLAGVVALAYPFDSVAVLLVVVGVWLVVLGVVETISAIQLRKATR